MKTLALITLTVLLCAGTPVHAQTGPATASPSVADLQGEVARLKEALAACEAAKAPIPASPQRADAIAALRAVKSALAAGANLQEFKRYYIESRIKTDALPDSPENQVAREISDLYRDAVSFSIVKVTGTISASELEAARKRYSSNEHIKKFLSDMKPNDSSRGLAHDINQIGGEATASVLLIQADERFKDLH